MAIPFIGDILETVGNLAGKFIKDKDAVEKFKHEVNMSLTKLDLAQIEVNKAEAASGSLFKGGWRPFIGWICGIAFAYHFVLQPIILFAVTAYGLQIPDLPEFDMTSLMTVLGGMLGIGGLRTYEKQKGLTK